MDFKKQEDDAETPYDIGGLRTLGAYLDCKNGKFDIAENTFSYTKFSIYF